MTSQVLVERQTPDALVLAVYERVLVGVPNVQVEGLWASGEHYYIVCPDADADTKGPEGNALDEWMVETGGWPLPPIDIVKEAPTGARRVPERTVAKTIELGGLGRIARDIFADLALALGPDFPPFSLVNDRGAELQIHVERALNSEELAALTTAAGSLDEPLKIVVVHPSRPKESLTFYRAAQGDLTLIPSRSLPKETPRRVRWLIEEDEEFWMSHRKDILLGSEPVCPADMFPDAWRGDELRCVVDAGVFPPSNIRSYLTLFETVILALPFGDGFDAALKALGTTSGELVDLVATGRVKLLLPQSVDRYDTFRLDQVLEASSGNVVASRRLACGVLADTRARMPFLGPPPDFRDRRVLMAALDESAQHPDMPPDLRRWFRVIADECRSIWHFAPVGVHRHGATETARVGIGWLASKFRLAFGGDDRTLEIMGAAAGVEWAGALGAHVFPRETQDYSEEVACDLLAAIAAPMDARQIPVVDPRVIGIVDQLLAIDNDAPVLEFAKSFRGQDVARFRALVNNVAAWNQDESFLRAEIEKFNAEVRQYERRPNRLRNLNLTSLVAAAVAELGPLPAEVKALGHLPLGLWLLGLLINMGGEPRAGGGVLGRLWDYSNGVLARTPARAVLVSRLRGQAKVLKP